MNKEEPELTVIQKGALVNHKGTMNTITCTSHTNSSVNFQHGMKRRDTASPGKLRESGKDGLVGTDSVFVEACPEVGDGITMTCIEDMRKAIKRPRQQPEGSSRSTSSSDPCPWSAVIHMEKEVPTVTHERNSQGNEKSGKKKKTKQKNDNRQLDPADAAVGDRAQQPANVSAGHRAPRASPVNNENPARKGEPTATRKRKSASKDTKATRVSPLDSKSRTLHGRSDRPCQIAGTAGRCVTKTDTAVIGADVKAVKTPAAGGTSARAAPRLSQLQQRMRQKLEGALFRMINETLYTSKSKTALAKFTREPELFDVVSP